MRTFIRLLCALTWELPQNLFGATLFCILYILKRIKQISIEKNRCFILSSISISLGWFVFWTANSEIKTHEYGHTLQSRMLGPFYLILVGIPSISRALYAIWYGKTYHTEWPNYFKGYPENWADKLGHMF